MLKYINQININMDLNQNEFKYFTLLDVNWLLNIRVEAVLLSLKIAETVTLL